jgi:hypothetical protein
LRSSGSFGALRSIPSDPLRLIAVGSLRLIAFAPSRAPPPRLRHLS